MTRTANFERVATGLDVLPLLARLDAMPHLWDEITARQEYTGTAHTDTHCIYPRGPFKFTPYFYMFDIGAYDYPVMDTLADVLVPILRPLLTDVLKVDALGRVLIVKLKPGGVITPHTDEGTYADHYARFHVAVTGTDKATLTAGGETHHLEPGDAWWFNHKVKHSARNDGDTDRIHIIIDAVTPLFPMHKVPVSDNVATTVASIVGNP
jgi:quercetin dioxygenase-like cupin family protein